MDYRLDFSDHAILRMAQRNLSISDVWYVVSKGRTFRSAGVTHHFLGKKDIPEIDRNKNEITRLEGTTVLSNFHNSDREIQIITLYRNKVAYKKLRSKTKYNKKSTNFGNLPLAK